MKILKNINDLNKTINKINYLGFVPTMGALHKGHISLIKESLKRCKKTIVSIYINPKQFNKKSDFTKYPYNINKDISVLKKINVDFLFIPKTHEIYKEKRLKIVQLAKSQKILCAKYRKGHFEGVLDVMDRLTKIIKPKVIFMGEKDFQQIFLVKKFLLKRHKTRIFSCKTIRDKNFLALSSRNYLLNKVQLKKAGLINKYCFELKRKVKKNNYNFLQIKKKRD